LFVHDLDAPAILGFLKSLETQRDNQVCSRNARLTAIRSFFCIVALRDPASVGIATRVLAVPRKRTDKRLVGYLTRDEMDAILAGPDQSTWIGRRDYALLLTMYNSGGRLSEMTGMRRRTGPVRFHYLSAVARQREERKSRSVVEQNRASSPKLVSGNRRRDYRRGFSFGTRHATLE